MWGSLEDNRELRKVVLKGRGLDQVREKTLKVGCVLHALILMVLVKIITYVM